MKKYSAIISICLVFLGIIVCMAILTYCIRSIEGFQNTSIPKTSIPKTSIPKTIWTFWDKEDIPPSVKLCIESWKKWNPGYDIILITRANYKKYVEIPEAIALHPLFNDSPQRFSDLIRLYLIAEKGGIWCDATNLMGQPLSEWMYSNPNKELYGFTIVYGKIYDRLPIIESWFFAAPSQSPFVIKWRDEFSSISQFHTHTEYVKSREAMGVDLREYGSPEYLAIHVAAQKILQIDKYPLDHLSLQPAEKGPFLYMMDSEWNSHKVMQLACTNMMYRKPFIKMRGPERHVLENGLQNELSNDKCKWL